jgi:hypothetical protein
MGLRGALELGAQVRRQDVDVGGQRVERAADLGGGVVARADPAVARVGEDRRRDGLARGGGGGRQARAEQRRHGERQGADATHDRRRC